MYQAVGHDSGDNTHSDALSTRHYCSIPGPGWNGISLVVGLDHSDARTAEARGLNFRRDATRQNMPRIITAACLLGTARHGHCSAINRTLLSCLWPTGGCSDAHEHVELTRLWRVSQRTSSSMKLNFIQQDEQQQQQQRQRHRAVAETLVSLVRAANLKWHPHYLVPNVVILFTSSVAHQHSCLAIGYAGAVCEYCTNQPITFSCNATSAHTNVT